MNKLLIILILVFSFFNCSQKVGNVTITEAIRLNQIGYYPISVKEFVVADVISEAFQIVDEEGNVVYSGDLISKGNWDQSGENILMGIFTGFQNPGKYFININDSLASYPFEIKDHIYKEALDASIKSFYFQRASMAIDEQYGGKFARAAGHLDVDLAFHPSSGKTEGILDSPGGWYDAGDYGKYIVNAAISSSQMLNLLELFSDVVKDNDLNIPESGNGISDLLDEIKYELDWMHTMQDEDGGVFFKLTALNFAGFIMPVEYNLERVIIGKSTTSTLCFAATMAQASRIFQNIDIKYADRCKSAALKAWEWALVNDNIAFKNPEDVRTGEYGDDDFTDDFYWAAAELYLTTGEDLFLEFAKNNEPEYKHVITNSWKFFIRNMGFHSLLGNAELLDEYFRKSMVAKHISLADNILDKINQIPYQMGLDHFEWGSNSDVLNQAMILCYAHHLTGEDKYLIGAIQSTDYIFGKNAVGFSFLTGFGSKKAMFPHHRPSGADGVVDPVPGFIVGGPNKDKQDKFAVEYKYNEPTRSFEDVEPSFASNEVCLNWNAPAVFVLGYLESVQ